MQMLQIFSIPVITCVILRYFLMHLRHSLAILCCFLAFHHVQAQVSPEYVQLSGIVYNQETRQLIPYANVTIPTEKRGAGSGADGFFTLVVQSGDTLQFTASGYAPKLYVVPDTGMDALSSIAVFLTRDTLYLDPFVVYPWPDKEDFREAFLAYQYVPKYTMQPIPGIRGKAEIDTVPKPPSPLWNPISFFYEEVVKPIQWKRPKPNKVSELPKWE